MPEKKKSNGLWPQFIELNYTSWMQRTDSHMQAAISFLSRLSSFCCLTKERRFSKESFFLLRLGVSVSPKSRAYHNSNWQILPKKASKRRVSDGGLQGSNQIYNKKHPVLLFHSVFQLLSSVPANLVWELSARWGTTDSDSRNTKSLHAGATSNSTSPRIFGLSGSFILSERISQTGDGSLPGLGKRVESWVSMQCKQPLIA